MSRGGASANGPVRLLLIGRPEESTRALQVELSAVGPDIEIDFCPALRQAPQIAISPEIVVVLQDHPDQAAPQEVRDLLDVCGLSRLIVCEGPWCASSGRTRQLWPAACRIPADRLFSRLQHELAVVRGAAVPLPLTANRDECWEYDFGSFPAPAGQPLAIAISTVDRELARWLSEVLGAVGHRLIDDPADRADVLLLDVDPWTQERAGSLSQIVRDCGRPPVVALTGCDWTIDHRALQHLGVVSVVTRLAPLSEWCRVLEQAATAACSDRRPLQIVADS